MIRIASIGTSSITHRTVQASRPVEGLRFTAAFSRDADRAAALAADLEMDASFDSFDAMLASDDIDAVYVATPNAIHADQVRAALTASKHVFVEKPAVASASEWDELCDLARAQGVVLLENMRTTYDPVMLRIAKLIPTLGELRQVALHFSQRSSRYDLVLAGETPAIFDPALDGGALSDLGIYLVHPLVRLLGVPDAVAASAVMLPTGADGAGAALASYPGMVAQLTWSKITAGMLPCSIEGELGTLSFDHVTDPSDIAVHYLDGRRLSEHPTKEADNITYQLRRFVDLVEGADATDDHRWTHDALALLAEIKAAIA